MIIPRVSEALDADLLRQKRAFAARKSAPTMAIMDLDAEWLAVAAIEEIANQLAKEGFAHPARWLRSQIGEK